MYEAQKKEIIHAGIMMDRYGLIALSGGNVSMRMEKYPATRYIFQDPVLSSHL